MQTQQVVDDAHVGKGQEEATTTRDPDQIPYLPEARDSNSFDDDHSSKLSSRYQIKLRKPQVAIDLNKPAPTEEFLEFKVKFRSDKDKIKELQKMVKQLN